MIIADILNREFIFPPIIQHYVLNHRNRGQRNKIKYWNFSDIYNYNNKKINNLIDNIENIESNNAKIYCLKYNNGAKLRMEQLFNNKCEKATLDNRRFSNKNDIKSLTHINDNILLLAQLYNNLQISRCFWNGCDTCPINKELIEPYKKVCRQLDFSNKIKKIGDKYIEDHLGQNYIALHIRYQDIGNTDIKKINKLYNESDIKNLLDDLSKNESNVPVFIATNNQKIILESELKSYKMLEVNKNNDELESFIEQYICCRSSKFVYSGGIHAKPTHKHLRSTWSSFVLDYRYCVLNKKCSDNIYLSNHFSNNKQSYGYNY